MSTSVDLTSFLRSPSIYAHVADQIEEATLRVPMFNQLQSLADRALAVEHFMWTEDAHKTAILCKRDGGEEEKEATFWCAGIVTRHCCMPFESFQEFNPREPQSLVPGGYQWVALIGPDLPSFSRELEAVRNLDVMARLRRAEGKFKTMVDHYVDGTPALVASTAISTPRIRLLEGDEPLTLTELQDPRGVITQWVSQRNHVIVEDNQVDVYLTARTEKAGEYETYGDGVAGATLRSGQIVRCEVGFRIVPAGAQSMMRMELKTVEILNANVTSELAFMQSDAEKEAGDRAMISVSSAGPSGLTIKEKSRVTRVKTKHQHNKKAGSKDKGLGELPFAPK